MSPFNRPDEAAFRTAFMGDAAHPGGLAGAVLALEARIADVEALVPGVQDGTRKRDAAVAVIRARAALNAAKLTETAAKQVLDRLNAAPGDIVKAVVDIVDLVNVAVAQTEPDIDALRAALSNYKASLGPGGVTTPGAAFSAGVFGLALTDKERAKSKGAQRGEEAADELDVALENLGATLTEVQAAMAQILPFADAAAEAQPATKCVDVARSGTALRPLAVSTTEIGPIAPAQAATFTVSGGEGNYNLDRVGNAATALTLTTNASMTGVLFVTVTADSKAAPGVYVIDITDKLQAHRIVKVIVKAADVKADSQSGSDLVKITGPREVTQQAGARTEYTIESTNVASLGVYLIPVKQNAFEVAETRRSSATKLIVILKQRSGEYEGKSYSLNLNEGARTVASTTITVKKK